MAKNWNVTEALGVVMEGKDLAAIRDIGRRFPLFLFFVLHDSLKIIEAFGGRVTVRTVNKHLEETLEDVAEIVVHADVQSKELELSGKEEIKVDEKLISRRSGKEGIEVVSPKEKVKKEKVKKEKVKKEKVEVATKDVEEDKIEVFDIKEEEEEVEVNEKVKDKKTKDEEVKEKEEIEEDDLDFSVEDLLEE